MSDITEQKPIPFLASELNFKTKFNKTNSNVKEITYYKVACRNSICEDDIYIIDNKFSPLTVSEDDIKEYKEYLEINEINFLFIEIKYKRNHEK